MGLRAYFAREKEAWDAASSVIRITNAPEDEQHQLWVEHEARYGPYEDGQSSR